MAMRTPKGGIRNEMREKAMREVILAQLGALRADVAVEGADRNHGEFLRDEATRNLNLAGSARLCSKDMMARIYEGKAAGYMAASRVVTEIREMNEHE